MPRTRLLLTALLGYALLGAAAGAQDAPASGGADPDGSFLEFLGSVDGLAEVNPNYISQANSAPPPASPPAVAPAKPPPKPQPPASPPGANKNE